ncbi:uncharacterized protein LAJ45_02687 [Morchella importuna]|uniref:uncharacterized protein n=1 Tax=Morchella importuna TaxID=1174673 RepID=UPI001E8E0E92|nr:uncharacterized protein LAJ45_02687 [Morchella importuna]KAH8153100.1 hypothetical protein LAJ45_02687 [Morchella importuna]
MLAGKTGSGKSSFVRMLGGLDVNGNEPVSDGGLESCTTKPTTYVTRYNGRTVLLLDTPGFDDSALDNLAILTDIVSNLYIWALQDKEIHTHGVVFLHDISETRFGGSQQKTLQLLKSMCGPEAMGNVIIGTTMWSDNGTKRQAQTIRVPDGDEDVAKSIIGDLLARPPTKLLVQTELLIPPHTCEATTVGRIAIPEGKREAERLAKEMEEQKLEAERLAKEKEEQREKERVEDRKRYEEEQERSRKEMEDRLEEEQKKNAEEREKREEEHQREREEYAEKQRKEREEYQRKQEEDRERYERERAEDRRRQDEAIAAANRRAEEAIRRAQEELDDDGWCPIIFRLVTMIVGKALGVL